MTTTMQIGDDEWTAAAFLCHFTLADEHSQWGALQVTASGGYRWWYAFDTDAAARLIGAADDDEYTVWLPPRVVQAGLRIAQGNAAELRLTSDDGGRGWSVSVTGPGGSYTTYIPQRSGADLSDFFIADEPSPCARVAADDLERCADALWNFASSSLDDESAAGRRLLIGTEDGDLRIIGDRPEGTNDEFRLPVGADDSDGLLAIAPIELVRAVSPMQGEVLVQLPDTGLLWLSDGRWTVVIGALESDGQRAARHVGTVIAAMLGTAASVRDPDGTFPLKRTGIPVVGRLHFGSPSRLEVYSVVLEGVPASPELLAELNDHNATLPFARLVHRDDRVVAQCDLVAETLDLHEFAASFRRVEDAGVSLAPVLAAVFGGEPADTTEDRWADYLNTVVSAEVQPGTEIDMNGEAAVEEWPFPGTVQVLTAWNPYTIAWSPDENAEADANLKARLAAIGLRWVHAAGRARDGSHAEEGVAVWGSTRDDMVQLAREFGQEAIFEIDADHLRLIHCETGRVEQAVRRQ